MPTGKSKGLPTCAECGQVVVYWLGAWNCPTHRDGCKVNLPSEAAGSEAARMLAEFHYHPNALGEGTNTQALRRTLHQEEHDELMYELAQAAEGKPDHRQIARELADVLYVTYGTAWAFGIDLDAALAEVHRAAMDKMNAGLRREDGKILKPPGFRPPDMTEAVRNAPRQPARPVSPWPPENDPPLPPQRGPIYQPEDFA